MLKWSLRTLVSVLNLILGRPTFRSRGRRRGTGSDGRGLSKKTIESGGSSELRRTNGRTEEGILTRRDGLPGIQTLLETKGTLGQVGVSQD